MAAPTYGSWTSLEASGAQILTDAFGTADDANITGLTGEHAVEIYVKCGFGSAPTQGQTIEIHLQPLNIDSASEDASAPDTSNPRQHFKASLAVDAATTTVTHLFPQIPVSDCDYTAYIYNRTSQTLSSTWVMKYRTVTY
jgi:hypothetical protein